MNWSLNEIDALARKAARGGGFSWGLAEEAGAAVRWLEARGLPGAAALAALLQAPGSPQTCPLTYGAYLCDGSDAAASTGARDLRLPLLAVPFLAWCAANDGAYLRVKTGVTDIVLGPDATWVHGGSDMPARASLEIAETQRPGTTPMANGSRANCAADALRLLEEFAARTYAPATEASRLAGAGAGLSDND